MSKHKREITKIGKIHCVLMHPGGIEKKISVSAQPFPDAKAPTIFKTTWLNSF